MRSEVTEREQNWNQKNREDKGEREQNWGERARSLFPLVSYYNCFLLQIGWRHNHQNCFIGSWCWLVLFLKQCVLLHKKQGAGLGKGEGGKLRYFGLFRKGCQIMKNRKEPWSSRTPSRSVVRAWSWTFDDVCRGPHDDRTRRAVAPVVQLSVQVSCSFATDVAQYIQNKEHCSINTGH